MNVDGRRWVIHRAWRMVDSRRWGISNVWKFAVAMVSKGWKKWEGLISRDWKVAVDGGAFDQYSAPRMSEIWPEAGSYLGHYRLVEKIDEGGMGAVFKAHEAALDRFVAVKVLSPQMAKDAEFVHSFLREARAVAAMNHPNIIQIYFIGQHDEFIYFAMELVEGHAFDRLMRAKNPTPKEWLGYIRQAALGLQYAQNHGVIHRDVKPANLILNELGMVKVTDFGLARNTSAAPEAASSAADTMGTPEYMSPEEAAGDPVDHRSDIYSLGATLYHLLAGKPAFSGSSGTEVMMHQMHTPLPSVRKINPQVPQSVAGVVEKCMAKKPEARFQTYDDLIRGIDDALNKKPATRVHVPQPTSGATFKPQPKGPGAAVWLVIIGIIAAAGFGIYKISEAQKQSRPKPIERPTKSATPPAKTETVRPVTPPVKPPVVTPPVGVAAWVPVDLVPAFNHDAISRKPSGMSEGIAFNGNGVLLTSLARKESGLPGPGVPDDGIVAIPGAEPAGRFVVNTIKGMDSICLTGAGGKRPAPAHVLLRIPMQQRYAKLALLATTTYGSGTINVTLHYTEGADQTAAIHVVDSYDVKNTPGAPHGDAKIALDVQPKDRSWTYALCSYVIAVDPTRLLRGFDLALADVKPQAAASGDEAKFQSNIFAISALHAGRAVAGEQTAISTNVAVAPPVVQTNIAVGIPTPPSNVVAVTPPANVVTSAPPAAPSMPPFRDVAGPVARLIGGLQLDMAESEAQRLAQTSKEGQKILTTEVQNDIRRLLAFRSRTCDGVSDHAGKNVSLQLRSGQRIDAQLVSADSTEIKLRKQFAAGFGETRARWFDILPVSFLPIYASAVDATSGSEMYDYALLLFYLSFNQQARPEDVRRALTSAAERDATLKAGVETHLKWLDEWGAPPPAPTATLDTPATTAQRPDRGIALVAGPSRWNWRCFDIGNACNADVIYTESRAATEEFQNGLGWTTAGWLARNNIAGDFNGIPDDGRVMIADNDPRLAFAVSMPPKKNVILLSGEGGRQPKPVRLDLPADLQGTYRRLSFLHACAGGDAAISAELLYADGTTQTKHLQTLNWETTGRLHDLSPDQVVAIATRSNRITVMSRLEIIAEIIDCDSDKPLVAITLSFESARSARAGAAPSAITAGIFAISGAPVGGTK